MSNDNHSKCSKCDNRPVMFYNEYIEHQRWLVDGSHNWNIDDQFEDFCPSPSNTYYYCAEHDPLANEDVEETD